MTKISDELWLQALLRNVGARADAFDGLQTHEQRKAHFRGVIKNHNVAETASTRQAGARNFGDLFRAIYEEEL